MTKLFVVGSSGAGKSPLAAQVAAAVGVPRVPASEWVRRLFPSGAPTDTLSRQQQIETMTRFALAELRRDPFACLAYLERHHDLGAPCVVEGMRNPFDFVRSFDPRHDLAVFLEHKGSGLVRTAFETGVDVMRDYVGWLVRVGLLDAAATRTFAFDDIAALDDAIAEATAMLRARLPVTDGDAGPRADEQRRAPSRVHAEIEPMPLLVARETLYGGDPKMAGARVPCRAFSFSSYPGSAPTFSIVLDDGAVFAYVPPSALCTREPSAPVLALNDLCYHNCPDGDVVVTAHAALAGPLLCFFKHRDLWLAGSYRFTVDWYRGNDLLHCVALDNGQIAFLPHHKIKFGAGHAPGFQPYKKMRNEWRVT